jgi:protein O-GlcNAc transferase
MPFRDDAERSEQGNTPGQPAADSGDLYRWLLAAEKAQEAGALDLAAEAFANAMRLTSDSKLAAQIWDSVGHVRWDQKRYDEAVEAFRESIFRDGTFAGPWHDIAQIRLAEGDAKAALESIREAIRRNPVRAKYWNTLGVIEIRLGRSAQAVASLRHHVELDPDSAAGWANLALAYLKQDRYGDAGSACRRSVELDPSRAALDALDEKSTARLLQLACAGSGSR